jgi:hypothetical protein
MIRDNFLGQSAAWKSMENIAKLCAKMGNSSPPDVVVCVVPIIAARSRHLNRFYSEKSDQKLLKEISKNIKNIAASAHLDPDLWPSSPSDAIAGMKRYEKRIIRAVEGIKKYNDPKKCPYRYQIVTPSKLRIEATGRCSSDQLKLTFNNKFAEPKNISIEYTKTNGTIISRQLDFDSKTENGVLTIDVPLIAEHRKVFGKDKKSPRQVLKVIPASYDLKMTNVDLNRTLLSLAARISGKFRDIVTSDNPLAISPVSMHAVFDERFSNEPLLWSGEKTFKGITRINRPVNIAAGTTVYMESGASLLISGKVSALGTKNQPIRFMRSHPNAGPWGTVALISKKSSNSRIQFVEFSGGSGLKRPLYEYSGMFSIHSGKNISIDNSIFRDSSVVDDMVHFVYAEVTIRNSKFINSHLDSIDADISELVMDHCIIEGSGNDALDLMTTKATLKSMTIKNSVDKGISIGESSELTMSGSTLMNNNIAIQSKDRSVGIIRNVKFLRNEIAADAYKKNWRYDGGGQISIFDSIFSGNKIDLMADKKSAIETFGNTNSRPLRLRKEPVDAH